MKNVILVRLILCILLVGSLFFGLQIALGEAPTPLTCPIGTQGAPNLRDPHIASGSLCRGACGLDCDPNRCNNVADVRIPVTDSAGNQFICVYKNVVECLTHDACRTHDACYDRAAEAGEMNLTGTLHQQCNQDCINRYSAAQCAAWTGIGGGMVDYFVSPPFDANRLPFSDPPELEACLPEESICNGKCTDTNSDSKNCGSCGDDCTTSGKTCCGGFCTDTNSDSKNCGSCGNDCTTSGTGDTCCKGKCKYTSEDFKSDSKNCGSCGNVCPPAESCLGGRCSGMAGYYPQTLRECENGGSEICGTWTLQGNQYYANWENGATATLNVDSWDASGVVITRYDSAGSSAGLSARYEGQLNGNTIENGKVTWTWNGSTWSGTWNANW